jgi:hypothetical protein
MGKTTVSVYVGEGYLRNVTSSGSTIFTKAYQVDAWTSTANEVICVAANGASAITESRTATDLYVILPSSVLGGGETTQQFLDTTTTLTGEATTTSGLAGVQTGHSESTHEQGLSTGAIVAIAVCVPTVVLAASGIGAVFLIRCRRRY